MLAPKAIMAEATLGLQLPTDLQTSQCAMSTEALESLLSAVESASEQRARILQSYQALVADNQELHSQVAALTFENTCIREDSRTLAAALQRKTLAASSSSMVVGQESASCLNDYLSQRNDQLLRDNARLRAELAIAHRSIDQLTARCKIAETEKEELQQLHSSTQGLCEVRRTCEQRGKSALSKEWEEKEVARLTQALAAEREVVGAYRQQNALLKDSRAELLKQCEALAAAARSLRVTVACLGDAKNNADFTASMWETHCRTLETAVRAHIEVRVAAAQEVRREGRDALASLLERCEEVPPLPQLVLLPSLKWQVAEPAIDPSAIDQLTAAQQRIVDLTERCAQLESSSQRLLTHGLLRLMVVLQRLQKARK